MMIFSLGAVVLWVYLNSRKRFTEAALRNAVVPLIVIVIMVIFWRSVNIALWVSIAYTFGFLVLFLLMMTTTTSRMGWKHTFKVMPTRNVIKIVLATMTFPLLGFGVMQGSRAVERMLATLVTVGGVASYYFAFRLVSGAQSLIGVSVATVGLPTITEHDLRGDKVKFNAAMKRRLGYAFLLSLPLCAVFTFLHKPVIRLMYGWGAFGLDSIQQTSTILQVLGIGVIFLSLVPVLNAGLYARRLYHWVFWGMLFTGLTDVLLAWWLSREHGLVGIAYAASITAFMTCLLLAWMVKMSGRVSSGVEA
jgi:murein biosynthesis integral membrane protein MurJ